MKTQCDNYDDDDDNCHSLTGDNLDVYITCIQGVINAAPLAYILPALCVLKLQQERIAQWRNLPCILTALFGVSISLIGFVLAVVEIAAGLPGCSHGRDLPYCHNQAAAELLLGGKNASGPANWYPQPMMWREDGS